MSSRDPSRPVDPSYGFCPAGICTYVIDEDTGVVCGKPAVYMVQLRIWEPADPPGGACAEHAAIVRTWPQLESMRSYVAGAR